MVLKIEIPENIILSKNDELVIRFTNTQNATCTVHTPSNDLSIVPKSTAAESHNTSLLSFVNQLRINIEKNLYFDVLWPDSQKMISDNAINNNSLVCKLNYNKFSMLFTGDIEEIAEKEIVSKYENNTSILKSTILKTAHHGSKTSSIEKILDVVKPQYAFIGVGENNTFGHPSNITIENLEKRKIKIYRTDKMGEICIKITKKAIIKINTKLNTS